MPIYSFSNEVLEAFFYGYRNDIGFSFSEDILSHLRMSLDILDAASRVGDLELIPSTWNVDNQNWEFYVGANALESNITITFDFNERLDKSRVENLNLHIIT